MSGVITVENLEKPKKDLKWLKEAVLELKNNGNPEINQTEAEREIGRLQELTWNNCVDRIYELINQLDESEASRQTDKLASFIMDEVEGEPSQSQSAVDTAIRIIKSYQNQATLSQEWIGEHTWHNHYVRRPFVYVKDLQNLLVPKQELPVIPKFVADYLGFAKGDVPLMLVMELANTRNEWPKWKKEYDWISANDETFARAWLDSFTVEEEQKYYVIFPSVDENGKGFNYLAKDTYHNELWVEDSRTDGLDWEERSSFTEDEIRNLDKGDVLFEHFTVKVEELEE